MLMDFAIRQGQVFAREFHFTDESMTDLRSSAIGVLLTLEEPTKAMRTEAASAGFYASP